MIYEMRKTRRIVNGYVVFKPAWQEPEVKLTRYWWRVRVAAFIVWMEAILPPCGPLYMETRLRVRIVDAPV